jgi:hypothetical protein
MEEEEEAYLHLFFAWDILTIDVIEHIQLEYYIYVFTLCLMPYAIINTLIVQHYTV